MRKSEGRNMRPMLGVSSCSGTSQCGRTRISDFGLLSGFVFRSSDFHFVRVCICISLTLSMAACRRDMFNQPLSKPLRASDFFQNNHMASRPLVQHTVARGHLENDEAFFTGKISTNLVEVFPFPITREVLERGRKRFNIYCAPCHGRTGDGNGMIVQRGFPVPPSYHLDRLRTAPVGHFVDVITMGYGVMYSYAQRVEPVDRWAIAAYIRALQKSHDARLEDVPVAVRAMLEKQK